MQIKSADFVISVADYAKYPDYNKDEITFVGRSNVGKSSLINYLTGRKNLARTSSMPGRTRLINVFDVNKDFLLVDLPGYGFAKRAPADKAQWSALTDGYFTQNPNIDLLKLVIQLVDSRIGPTADDEMMLSFLREADIPFLVVATKSDKLNATERKKSEEMLKSHPDIPADTPIVFYSALKGEGRTDLWKLIAEYTGIKL